MSKPKNPRTAGVATSTSMTALRISKSFNTAAPPSRRRPLRPRYSAGLASPCKSQRGESGGTESVWQWATHTKRRATPAPARANRNKGNRVRRFAMCFLPCPVRKFQFLAQASFIEYEFDEPCRNLVKRRSKLGVVAGKSLPELSQIHAAFDVFDGLKHRWSRLPQLFIHLIHRALHQIAQQINVSLVVQDGAVPGNYRVRIQLRQAF